MVNGKLTNQIETTIKTTVESILRTARKALDTGDSVTYTYRGIHIDLIPKDAKILCSFLQPRILAIVVPQLEELFDAPVRVEIANGYSDTDWAYINLLFPSKTKES